jgi:hypothetical protein
LVLLLVMVVCLVGVQQLLVLTGQVGVLLQLEVVLLLLLQAILHIIADIS